LELHKKSQERVKQWGNTISGARKARIENVKMKEEIQEREKQIIDAEWAAERNKLREEMISNARSLQYQNTPKIVELHTLAMNAIILKVIVCLKTYIFS
jgi:hypothetical protein